MPYLIFLLFLLAVAGVVVSAAAAILLFAFMGWLAYWLISGIVLIGRGSRAKGTSRIITAVFWSAVLGLVTWAVN